MQVQPNFNKLGDCNICTNKGYIMFGVQPNFNKLGDCN